MISRVLLILALAVLAYIVYITIYPTEKFTAVKDKKTTQLKRPSFTSNSKSVKASKTETPTSEKFNNNINYETFADTPGAVEVVNDINPAAFKDNKPADDGLYATVNFSGLVDANPNDTLQIEGTDLLTAPLVDNMLYTNSISNVNRNASQDLRGDVSVQFDKNYTPFYTSTIAGVDRLGGSMNIGRAPITPIPAVAV